MTCSPWVPLLQWRGLPHSSTAPRIDQKEGGGTTVPLFRAYDNVSVSYLSMGSPGIRPIRLYRFTEDNVSTSFWNVFQIRILYIYISLEDIEEILFNYSNNFVYNFEYEEKNRITSYEESEKKKGRKGFSLPIPIERVIGARFRNEKGAASATARDYTPKLYRARVIVGARSRPEHRYSPVHGSKPTQIG